MYDDRSFKLPDRTSRNSSLNIVIKFTAQGSASAGAAGCCVSCAKPVAV